ncbi:MAG: hypothetical protein OXM55_01990 [Bdellovibrionales bacterium]|nr:hypothetical protein [Bdellovibrionales bacterium]
MMTCVLGLLLFLQTILMNSRIPLHSVQFVNTWKELDWVKASDEDLAGIFTMHTVENKIIVLFPMKTIYWEHSEEWLRSLLAHEMFHYFQKSCCYEKMKKIDNMNVTLFEASAYWAQDQFLRRNFDKDLVSYMKNGKIASLKRFNDFETRAYSLYGFAMELYLFNAPLWFGEQPREKFKRLIEGHYRIKHY